MLKFIATDEMNMFMGESLFIMDKLFIYRI